MINSEMNSAHHSVNAPTARVPTAINPMTAAKPYRYSAGASDHQIMTTTFPTKKEKVVQDVKHKEVNLKNRNEQVFYTPEKIEVTEAVVETENEILSEDPARGQQDAMSTIPAQGNIGDPLTQRPAIEEGHYDEGAAIDLVDLVNGADVGMIEFRGGLGFPLETLAAFFVAQQVRSEEFEGDGAVESGVLGLIDDSHAAFTKLLGDLVVRDGLADHAGPILPRFT